MKMMKFSKLLSFLTTCSDKTAFWWLTVFFLVWNGINLRIPVLNGDFPWKWKVLRYLHAYGTWFPEKADQHLCRWSFNVPEYLIASLFDFHPFSYYILPVFFMAGSICLLYTVCRKLQLTPFLSLCIAMTAVINAPVCEFNCQFEPMLGGVFFIFIAVYIGLYILDKNKNAIWWSIPAIFMFLAYGSKVTAGYYCAGIVLFLCFCMKKDDSAAGWKIWKHFQLHNGAIVFCVIFFLLMTVETFILNKIFSMRLGRLEAILNNHYVYMVDHKIIYTFWELPFLLFQPFWHIGARKIFLGIFFLLTVAGGVYWLVDKQCTLSKKMLAFIFLCSYVLHCCMVISFTPPRPPEPFILRYVFPALLIGYIIWLAAIPELWQKFKGYKKRLIQILFIISIFLYIFFSLFFVMRASLKKETMLTAYRGIELLMKSNKYCIPVLLEISDEKVSKEEYCIADDLKAYFGPVEDLKNKNALNNVCKDENGRFFLCLWGNLQIDNAKRQTVCYIVVKGKENRIFEEKLILKPYYKRSRIKEENKK